MVRGAPCNATWEWAATLQGLLAEEAAEKASLTAQYFCKADPSGFDPLSGQSPVHVAGQVHSEALLRALEAAAKTATRRQRQ